MSKSTNATVGASEFFKSNIAKQVEAGRMTPEVAVFHERIMDAVAQAMHAGVTTEDLTEALATHAATGAILLKLSDRARGGSEGHADA